MSTPDPFLPRVQVQKSGAWRLVWTAGGLAQDTHENGPLCCPFCKLSKQVRPASTSQTPRPNGHTNLTA